MAAATFSIIQDIQGLSQPQTPRKKQMIFIVDFDTAGDGTGLAATEDMAIGLAPAGYVHERLDTILLTAEGTTATLDVGTEANDDGFLDGGNMNGTPNARVAPGGSEAFAPGTLFAANTEIRVKTPSGAATLDDAKVMLIFNGYMIDLP